MLSAFRRSTTALPRTFSQSLTTVSSSLIRSDIARSTIKTSRAITNLQSPSAVRSIRSFHQTCLVREAAATHSNVSSPDGNGLVTRFDELVTRGMVHPNVVRSLKQMGIETMTDVQSATINEALKGTDILAQARTGTGKTLGFLIPVLQNMISQDPHLAERSFSRRGARTTADDIRAIIISPTRELAEQIAVEARRVTQGTSVIVQTAVGGTRKQEALRAMQREGSHILVGTPGRIKDIFSDPHSGVSAPGLDALVFDEADRLLDQGFWEEIKEIIKLLPKPEAKDRQTLMFSATVPQEVMGLVKTALKPGHKFVRTVREDEEPTHTRVPQRSITVNGLENLTPTLVELILAQIEKHQADPHNTRPFKAIVYFNSTAETTCLASTLRNLPTADSLTSAGSTPNEPPTTYKIRVPVLRRQHPFGSTTIHEIHGKLSQGQRTNAANRFRDCRSGILISSDVTARGMDFPNVTHVIQIGMPGSKDTYIHRIGRTARAGKEGEGYILLTPLDQREMKSRLRGLPIQPVEPGTFKTAEIDMTREAQVPASAATILRQVGEANRLVSLQDKESVYMAMLGTYGWYQDKQGLIDAMNNLSRYGFGFAEPPGLSPLLLRRLGMNRVMGTSSRSRSSFGGGDRGGRSSFGGGDRGGRSSFGGGDRGGRSSYGGASSYGGGDRGGRSSFGGGDRGGRSSFGGGDRGGRSSYGGGSSSYGGGSSSYGGGDRGSRSSYGGGGSSYGSSGGDRGGYGGERKSRY